MRRRNAVRMSAGRGARTTRLFKGHTSAAKMTAGRATTRIVDALNDGKETWPASVGSNWSVEQR